MPLTQSFRDTVRARAEREPAFRRALFQEAAQALLQGETDEGRAALRAYINATIGFDRLGEVLKRSPKSLMRMFGPDGNPKAENLLGVIGALQEETGVHLKIRAHPDVLEFAEVLNSGLGKIPPITGKQGTVYRG
jgi:hypothetical protein